MATLDFTYKGIILSGRVPEANIQAEFYRLCRKYGIEVLLFKSQFHDKKD